MQIMIFAYDNMLLAVQVSLPKFLEHSPSFFLISIRTLQAVLDFHETWGNLLILGIRLYIENSRYWRTLFFFVFSNS